MIDAVDIERLKLIDARLTSDFTCEQRRAFWIGFVSARLVPTIDNETVRHFLTTQSMEGD